MKKKKKIRNQLYTSVLLVLMALVAVTAGSNSGMVFHCG